ncbi:hypothetical protein ACFLTB_03700 [Chloroflexota bacterium]
MENVPPFIVITTIVFLGFSFFTFIFTLFGWLKINPSDIKKFVAIRGRTLAWNAYLVIAILITAYFIFVLSLIISYLTFSFSLVVLLILLLWAMVGTWSPALQRLHNKRINIAVEIIYLSLLHLTIAGFWIVQWPQIQQPIFVTLLLLAIDVIYIIDRVIKKRKISHDDK